MRTGKYVIIILAVMALLVGTQTASNATPTLQLSSGATTITVADGQVGPPPDANPLPNSVTYIGPVGAFWTINITSGLLDSTAGGILNDMHLNSVDTSTGTPLALDLQWSATNFTGPISNPGGLFFGNLNFGPILGAGATATFNYWVDPTNTLFGHNLLLGTGSFSQGNASIFPSFVSGVTAPFSITEEVILTHPATGTATLTSSFDQDLTPGKTPEPMTLILYGVGFAGAGLYRRMRGSK